MRSMMKADGEQLLSHADCLEDDPYKVHIKPEGIGRDLSPPYHDMIERIAAAALQTRQALDGAGIVRGRNKPGPPQPNADPGPRGAFGACGMSAWHSELTARPRRGQHALLAAVPFCRWLFASRGRKVQPLKSGQPPGLSCASVRTRSRVELAVSVVPDDARPHGANDTTRLLRGISKLPNARWEAAEGQPLILLPHSKIKTNRRPVSGDETSTIPIVGVGERGGRVCCPSCSETRHHSRRTSAFILDHVDPADG